VNQKRAANARSDRPALHPWSQRHLGAGVTSLAMRGKGASAVAGGSFDAGTPPAFALAAHGSYVKQMVDGMWLGSRRR
jgi:hypothetical protein